MPRFPRIMTSTAICVGLFWAASASSQMLGEVNAPLAVQTTPSISGDNDVAPASASKGPGYLNWPGKIAPPPRTRPAPALQAQPAQVVAAESPASTAPKFYSLHRDYGLMPAKPRPQTASPSRP